MPPAPPRPPGRPLAITGLGCVGAPGAGLAAQQRALACGADVVVTVTPAREPLVKDEWIAPGTHIAALGAA